MQHLWGTFEVYVMAENDLTLPARSLISGKAGMGLKRVNFVVMLIAQKERDFLALFAVCEGEFIAKGVV